MLYIYTLHWNVKEKLNRLYKSLDLSNCKWFIKDNNSSDESVQMIESWKNSNINLIKYPNNNQTFSEGMNFLFKESSPNDDDDVLFLNNDVAFNDLSSIKNMQKLLSKNVVMVGARLLYTNSNKLQHAGVVFHQSYKTPYHFRANEESDDRSRKNREFQAVTGAVMLTKAKYLKSVNKNNKSGIPGFDENLKWAFDDIDLCLSLKQNKGKVVYCGETNISHDESFSLKKNPINKLFMNHNIKYFLDKWKGKYMLDGDLYKNNFSMGLI